MYITQSESLIKRSARKGCSIMCEYNGRDSTLNFLRQDFQRDITRAVLILMAWMANKRNSGIPATWNKILQKFFFGFQAHSTSVVRSKFTMMATFTDDACDQVRMTKFVLQSAVSEMQIGFSYALRFIPLVFAMFRTLVYWSWGCGNKNWRWFLLAISMP